MNNVIVLIFSEKLKQYEEDLFYTKDTINALETQINTMNMAHKNERKMGEAAYAELMKKYNEAKVHQLQLFVTD